MTKYGQQEQFLCRFNPDSQLTICANSDDCFFGDYPTLTDIAAYGQNFPIVWLMPQLENVSEFAGCREKMDGNKMEELAHHIKQRCHHYKISELMLFFYRVKAGCYGCFYGSVDPMRIMEFLRQFSRERSKEIDEYESEMRRRERDEHSKRCVTREEYEAYYKPRMTAAT